MKSTIVTIASLLLISACVSEPPPCPGPEEKWIAVGFYRSGASINRWELPIDTMFSSVYPLGSSTELAQRRINNFFLLPIPHAGGRVNYVFQQNDRQDTLSLFFTTSVGLYADDCGLLMHIRQAEVLQETTTLEADSINIGYYFTYDDPKAIATSLGVFVP